MKEFGQRIKLLFLRGCPQPTDELRETTPQSQRFRVEVDAGRDVLSGRRVVFRHNRSTQTDVTPAASVAAGLMLSDSTGILALRTHLRPPLSQFSQCAIGSAGVFIFRTTGSLRKILTPLFALCLVTSAVAEDTVDYARQIKPVLQARCYACHGVLKQEAALRLDTVASAVKGGDSGSAIKAGDAAASLLLKRVSSASDDDRMPPEGEPLKPDEIAALTKWIAAGAVGPADEKPERDPRDHWSFQSPVRPSVPQVAWRKSTGGEPVTNPIDAFIAASHQQHGVTPQPPAAKSVWLRRVSLDLIGLPPTRNELDAFLSDSSAEAYDKVVIRLLDSPHYGERWGRHWMDIWRYSDWWGLGEDQRNSQKHIWHWRDWIVESLNADRGYDQMLREMLAADELYPGDLDRLRAGGFLARQYFKFNRTSWLDETIEHTAKAMIGLTFNCAKCHDHKYDPFTQADYYRFRAVFEPYQVRLDSVGGQIDYEKDGIPRPFDCNLDVKTFLHVRGDDRNPDTSRVMEPAVPAFLSRVPAEIKPVTLPPIAYLPGLSPHVIEAHLKQAEQRITEKQREVETARKRMVETEQLAAKPAPDGDAKTVDAFAIRDDFSAARPELWETCDGKWNYADGMLTQSADGPIRGVLQLKQLPPADFEARLTFVPTGGQMWKSVGITFDATETNECLAYLSAYAGGSKAQFAFKQGDYQYPADGSKGRSIELNKPYELLLRVKGSLVNIGVNGEHVVAYRIPIARQRGPLQVITYDAQAQFKSFELRDLPAGLMLVEANKANGAADVPMTPEQSRLALTAAEKSLAFATIQPASIRTRAAADQARYQSTRSDEQAMAGLVREAARMERLAAVAKSEEDVARAEFDLSRAATDKKTEFETKLTTARTTLETAQKGLTDPGDSYVSLRGSLKALESNLETDDSRQKPYPTTSTGRRTALANWITDRQHPLTARVAVNHLWSRHFGRPLVPTVFDFGRKGTPPTHPELLDWLAIELMEGRPAPNAVMPWSMKHLHRLIVTSQTYHMTSSAAGAETNVAADPDNRFYWRMNPIRLESQIVRDSLISLGGELDLTIGGPPIPVNNEASRRRSLYYFHSNIDRQKFLAMFDDASVLDCYRRAESIVPQQALALENSSLATEMAQKISARLSQAATIGADEAFVRDAFLTVLCVEPTAAELAAVLEAIPPLTAAARKAQREQPEQHARIQIIQALLNHNDFVTSR